MNINEQYEAAFVADPTLRPKCPVCDGSGYFGGGYDPETGDGDMGQPCPENCQGQYPFNHAEHISEAVCRAAVFTRLAETGHAIWKGAGGRWTGAKIGSWVGPVAGGDDLDTALLAALAALSGNAAKVEGGRG